MTPEDAMPVVGWRYRDTNPDFADPGPWQFWPKATRLEIAWPSNDNEPLVLKSAALAALTLVQAERDAALTDAESWRQQADSRTADAVRFGAERDAMQQERDELRAALERIERWFGEFPETGEFWDDERTRPMSYGAAFGSNGERDFMRAIARAALTPKATQQETRA